MEIHACFLLNILSSSSQPTKEHLTHFLYYSIFCNKMDLSLTAGNQVSSDCLKSISSTFIDCEGDLLINNVESVCRHLLAETKTFSSRVHFVLDNAGLEFFSDICLSIYLLQTGLASDIVFHVKVL
uniref:Sugar phosphate phosphatase n=1 Tax=Myxobolus squamalis TaxID=59785 RepID=A0A6B2FX69_MYXSQ